MKWLFSFCLLSLVQARADFSPVELGAIGRKVWLNECDGTVAGLTSWNAGEDFASLGIGHFIWYPAGRRGPFEESFPRLMVFAEARGEKPAAWMRGACPWNSRAEFLRDEHGARMTELRKFLRGSVSVQAGFLVQRMDEALPKILSGLDVFNRERVKINFMRLKETVRGVFSLIDYVNFKGEGILPTERYHGEGWGLRQVLAAMPASGDAVREFSAAAAAVLTQRVRNALAERHEERWLPGWKNRVESY